MAIRSEFNAIDIYCGSGAVTEGMKAEGITVLAAIDNDPIACETYRLNHPEVHLFPSDIRRLNPATIRKNISFSGRLDLLVVCAPCQPFSSQNRKRSADDHRADLVLESLKFIKEFEPEVVFFENVPGIAISGPLHSLRHKLAELGYTLAEPKTLNAADCGVPQRRERCIMVAARNRECINSFYDSINAHPTVTVRQTIGGLRQLCSGERDPDDPLHFARNHQPIVLQRLQHIPQDGGSRLSLPPELELKCHKGRKNDFPDVYGRMRWDDVAPTLTTGCTDVTKGRFAHPRDNRAITLREAALLQSFPPHYRFSGNSGQIARQIGNAVPVNMIRTLAPALKCCLQRVRNPEATIAC
ncbi:DNA cytosine methyltransferase [Geobacter argillaceus]|uniref:Cytosine-specific methyltransferase n=1 Tax=Geobacter argillaceus TaxID=345631 RepID=A0A562VIK5_9BACT|nr:DNA cytosine methyltransferase [Geobacter argillaceus]TWJ17614.1 DNA (cytosine-5)-methyltransferase 1 [Geobacter argillaceus]